MNIEACSNVPERMKHRRSLVQLIAPVLILIACAGNESAAAIPTIQSFETSSVVARVGERVTLSWEIEGADSIAITPQVGPTVGTSVEVDVRGTTVFTLAAANRDGTATSKVKIYDRDQTELFTDTILMAAVTDSEHAIIREALWDGTIVKRISMPGVSALSVFNLFDVAVDAEGLLLAGVRFYHPDGPKWGLMQRDPTTEVWEFRQLPDRIVIGSLAGELTVAGDTAYFGAHAVRLSDLETRRITTSVPELTIAPDGFVHAGDTGMGPTYNLKRFDPLTGEEVEGMTMLGVLLPARERDGFNVRSVATTANGERFVGSMQGYIYRIRSLPPKLIARTELVGPGGGLSLQCSEVQVSADGEKILAGLQTRGGTPYFALTDPEFSEVRYIYPHEDIFSHPADLGSGAFSFTGLTRPRVGYFRVSETVAAPGGVVELVWEVAGTERVAISGVGDSLPAEGSARIVVDSSTDFRLAATNQWGTTERSVEVLVDATPIVHSFTATEPVVPLGETTVLQWSVAGAEVLHLSPGLGRHDPESGTLEIRIAGDISVVLTAENSHGRTRAELQITAAPPVTDPIFVDLIPRGAQWSWLHPVDGRDPVLDDLDFPSSWMLPAGYDGPAFSGPSPAGLGYGLPPQGEIDTPIGTPPEGARHAAYFRRTFEVPENIGAVTLEPRINDGAVYYLDGVERIRQNYAGPVHYRGNASGVGAADRIVTIPLGRLAPGVRTLAVSVHNVSDISPDLYFDLRLKAVAQWHGLPPDSEGRRGITFSDSPIGAASHVALQGGSADLGWRLTRGEAGTVVDVGGKAFLVTGGEARLQSDRVDLRGMRDVSAHLDLRVYETGEAANGFESPDEIEAWVETSTDGINFSRGATLVPLRRGGAELSPPNDRLSEWNRGLTGPMIRLETAPGAIHEEAASARIVVAAENDETNEHFIFDNIGFAGSLEVIDPDADTDADGLPDIWENELLRTLEHDAADDPDGDGQSNAEEHLAGTHPLRADSNLRVLSFEPPSLERSGLVQWTSVTGRRYDVQVSSDLSAWETLDSGVPADGMTTSWTIPTTVSGPGNAFRIRITP